MCSCSSKKSGNNVIEFSKRRPVSVLGDRYGDQHAGRRVALTGPKGEQLEGILQSEEWDIEDTYVAIVYLQDYEVFINVGRGDFHFID